jgi:hypothetical protein
METDSPEELVDEPVASAAPFAPGTRVMHATFGEGRVVRSQGQGQRHFLTIEFPREGLKVIAARYVERL